MTATTSIDLSAVCGVGYQQRSDERNNSWNGYRERFWDTRAGSIESAIPKLRSGSYFPDWLLARRRRSEQALVTAVATSYLLGVSPQRMERLVAAMGVTGLSKSRVSQMAAELDTRVEAFRTRPLDAGPYTFVAADALTVGVREGGRVIKVTAMVATGINADAATTVSVCERPPEGARGPGASRRHRARIDSFREVPSGATRRSRSPR